MGTLTNNEDPDEMPHHATFHQGLHCSLGLPWLQNLVNVYTSSNNRNDSIYTKLPN